MKGGKTVEKLQSQKMQQLQEENQKNPKSSENGGIAKKNTTKGGNQKCKKCNKMHLYFSDYLNGNIL